MNEIETPRPALLPDRMKQADFFVCDIFDAAPKGDMASMEHPVFSISTKPDTRIRRYEDSKGINFIEVTPSVKGLATVHDRDVLIFCISQLMAALNRGEKVSQRIRFKAYDLLKATNRPTGGESYVRLKESLERLRGTTISTNIVTGGVSQTKIFGLVDSADIIRETHDGRMQEVEINLADWVFNAIEAQEVLTLHRDYFRLRKPLERRLYEIARKHCGRQTEWRIGLHKLRIKCGSSSRDKEFKRLITSIVEADQEHSHMPDYSVTLDGNNVVFRNRGSVPTVQDDVLDAYLDPEAFHDARTVAPGWDVHYLETEWRKWCGKEEISPKRPANHFIKFCETWSKNHNLP